MATIIEVTLSWLLKNARSRDEKCFFTGPAFAEHKEETITVISPDCGPSGATLGAEYMASDGGQQPAGRFPTLEWKAPDDVTAAVKEWLVIVEDPDAPLPTPIAHGVYGGIPVSKTTLGPADLEIADEGKALLRGGFHYGTNRRKVVYIPPRPLINHGVHRYFFEVIALSELLDKDMLSAKASREQVAEAIGGKVLGWGMWEGSCERKL